MRFDVFAAPIEERGHRTDLHRVEMDVADKHQQILVSFHQLALVAPTQQMPLPPAFLTEMDRIAGVELLHERGQVGPRRFTQNMVMVGRQNVGVESDVVGSRVLEERPEKAHAVCVRLVDRPTFIAPRRGMVDRPLLR